MTDVKQDLTQAEKDAKAAILAKMNAEGAWLKAHALWLGIAVAALAVGFILGHLVKL